jgi:hypothetical protein
MLTDKNDSICHKKINYTQHCARAIDIQGGLLAISTHKLCEITLKGIWSIGWG